MKRPPGLWLLLSAGVLCLSLQAAYTYRAPSLRTTLKSTTTTTTAAPSSESPAQENNEEVATEIAETEGDSNSTQKLTGIPQLDYVHDPNLPKELNGYNLTEYPFYERVPDPEEIDFKCDGLHDGFYASILHKCQVYHHCLFGTRYDFLCANYTAFDQKTFICHFASEVDCANSKNFWHRNDALYQAASTTTAKPPNIYTTPPPDGPSVTAVGGAIAKRPSLTGRRRRPFRRRRPQYDYYEYEDEEDVEDEYELPDRRRKRPRPRPRPVYDDEYDYYEDERPIRRPYDRRPADGNGRRRNKEDRRKGDEYVDDEVLDEDYNGKGGERKVAAKERRNDDSRYDDRIEEDRRSEDRRSDDRRGDDRRNDDRRSSDRRKEERRNNDDRRQKGNKRRPIDDYEERPATRRRKGAKRPVDDDYYDSSDEEVARPDKRKEEEQLLVKPTTGTIYDRPRVAPRIKPPVPKKEANKFAFKSASTTTTAKYDDEEYYEDYEEEVEEVLPKKRVRPSQKAERTRSPYRSNNDERKQGSASRYRSQSSKRPIDDYVEEEEIERRPSKQNKPKVESDARERRPISSFRRKPPVDEEEEEYEEPVEEEVTTRKYKNRFFANRNDKRNKEETTTTTTERTPSSTTAATTTTTTNPQPVRDVNRDKPEPIVRIVKRPFLPSRGGNPYVRGLSPVGSKARKEDDVIAEDVIDDVVDDVIDEDVVDEEERAEPKKPTVVRVVRPKSNNKKNDGRTTQSPKFSPVRNPLDINENEYDVTLNDALNPTLPNLPVRGFPTGFSPTNDYPATFNRQRLISEPVAQPSSEYNFRIKTRESPSSSSHTSPTSYLTANHNHPRYTQANVQSYYSI